MADKYNSMKELYTFEPMENYKLTVRRNRSSKVFVMAPHGGAIEYFTSEIANAVAGKDFKFHDFAGVMPERNFANLHVTSKHYDCAVMKSLNEDSLYTLAIHGCTGKENERVTYLGGGDTTGCEIVRRHLERAGFAVKEAPPHLSGKGSDNVVNQNQRGMGIQLEISIAQRLAFTYMPLIAALIRRKHSKFFDPYCTALRHALSELSGETLSNPE